MMTETENPKRRRMAPAPNVPSTDITFLVQGNRNGIVAEKRDSSKMWTWAELNRRGKHPSCTLSVCSCFMVRMKIHKTAKIP